MARIHVLARYAAAGAGDAPCPGRRAAAPPRRRAAVPPRRRAAAQAAVTV
ncbi:hypothetical protein H1V43_17145 [Streptomyces sp. PSKA54]|uniref:Uncharacterized protein n=1 Tax=Streptomyces himalayensis subsp. aureolus TaxID=2758039 RepID=A0A7W2D1J8_9ACTN|nr:hypothetical protein [Streptomyces himalayensis]MBA4863075.1 hypothetical protein [Streptomyces himalayensis subsp. aureolus]